MSGNLENPQKNFLQNHIHGDIVGLTYSLMVVMYANKGGILKARPSDAWPAPAVTLFKEERGRGDECCI